MTNETLGKIVIDTSVDTLQDAVDIEMAIGELIGDLAHTDGAPSVMWDTLVHIQERLDNIRWRMTILPPMVRTYEDETHNQPDSVDT